MHILLEVAKEVVPAVAREPSFTDWLSAHEETIGKIIGSCIVIAGMVWSHLTTKRVPKTFADAAKTPEPTALPSDDVERQTMRARLAENEQHTRYLVAVFERGELERHLRAANERESQLREALRHERDVNAEMVRVAAANREMIAQLKLVNEILPLDDDWDDDRTPTRSLGQRKNAGP